MKICPALLIAIPLLGAGCGGSISAAPPETYEETVALLEGAEGVEGLKALEPALAGMGPKGLELLIRFSRELAAEEQSLLGVIVQEDAGVGHPAFDRSVRCGHMRTVIRAARGRIVAESGGAVKLVECSRCGGRGHTEGRFPGARGPECTQCEGAGEIETRE